MEKVLGGAAVHRCVSRSPTDLIIPTKRRNLLFCRQSPSTRNEKRNRAATECKSQITNYKLQIVPGWPIQSRSVRLSGENCRQLYLQQAVAATVKNLLSNCNHPL